MRRLGLPLVLALLLGLTVGAGAARADTAPLQWQPTTTDLARTLRPCPMAVASPTAPVCWSVTEDTGAWMAQPAGSPYPWGQCTYYVGLMRPDVWNDRAPPSEDPLYQNWDAWTWVEHAEAEGLPVDDTPQPGDVMVYSRAAVDNDTGHVAMVDAVEGTDPATGDEELTVSEMNVEGLDNASLGQGDTMTLLIPESELVPGMIQFIHRPPAGYTAPVWPAGSTADAAGADDANPTATTASVPAATGDPSLSVGLSADALETVSESTSPVQVTITALPSGQVVKRLTVTANRITPLSLPTGSYRACVGQTSDGTWPTVSQCATGAWRGPATRLVLSVRHVQAAGRHLSFAVALSPGSALLGNTTAPVFLARLRIVGRQAAATGRATKRTVTLYRATVRLRSGTATLRLPVAASVLHADHAVLQLTLPAQADAGLRVTRAVFSARL